MIEKPRRLHALRFAAAAFLAGLALLALLAALAAAPASATKFCVPGYSPACQASEGGVVETDLEEAMALNGEDGQADEIVVAPGTFDDDAIFEPDVTFPSPEYFQPAGTDPLTIVGAGTGATVLTSDGTGNVSVLALSTAIARDVTMRDLTLRIPASFPNGQGSALQLATDDVVEDVEIVSLNPDSDAVTSVFGTGNVLRGVEIRGEGPGTIGAGVRVGSSGAHLLVEDVLLSGVSWGLIATDGGSLTARRVVQSGTRTYGAMADDGNLTLENSILDLDSAVAGLQASSVGVDTSLSVDHVTMVDSDPSGVATELVKTSGAGDVSLTIANSIVRDAGPGYFAQVVKGGGVGTASLTVRYSNFPSLGISNGVIDSTVGNIDADPLLTPDLSLPPGSPSVDAGDPAVGGLATDFLGAMRPNDGDGDGVAVRDQGAFEYQRPAPPNEEKPGGDGGGGGGSGGGGGGGSTGGAGQDSVDRTAPQTRIAKGPGARLAQGKAMFVLGASEAGARFECKLDGRKRARCKSPKTYSGLKPGRHTFRVWAIDAAGNADPTPVKRTFRIPAP